MILADKIITLRKKNGWSQEELAEKLKVSRQAVSKWEGAQTVPDLERVLQMSQLFGVTTDYLLKELVSNLKNEGKTIILLTHEIEKCLGLADFFVVLFRGKKVFEGTPQMALQQNLEQWNIKNPLCDYKSLQDFVW